MAAFIF